MNTVTIERIKAAIKIAERALTKVLPLIKAGSKEKDISKELHRWIRFYGAKKFSFRPIVASGRRSAAPHARASQKRLKPGDIVVIDFGTIYKGYCSDITRSFVVGRPSKRQKQIHKILKQAQRKAIRTVKSGIAASLVDKAARGIIAKHKLDKYLKHNTCHGIGCRVHEAPKLSSKNKNVLKSGMILTIEPGIYIKGWGGMRIEDMVLVMDSGCRVLTSAPKELLPG